MISNKVINVSNLHSIYIGACFDHDYNHTSDELLKEFKEYDIKV